MTQQFMKLVLGGTDDLAEPSSSNHPFQFLMGGDTIRVKLPRVPTADGYVGELCWSLVEGVARLHLCIVSATYDVDGEILTPAVWHSCTFSA